ncbi:hypothetical protein CROQUDRAFT_53734 [Cronartium quercuum f. sp. fusiforme G11]|uniref:SCA7 domain-containing protein n=1 Tax=Cronartium quercuum f. sp. fusiforme G11 TaxID=708437 RepID=A0A9P6N634_9BASI|nr:hypothetical protein CROQUDRAFT_53734 [Cronartium quercuum f. sp. fusiforme G11]
MALKLKPIAPALSEKLQSFESTLTTLANAPDRWKLLRALAKQQTAEAPARPSAPSPDDPGPVWTKGTETLFGAPDEQLRVIRCAECGILTREVNNRVCVTHKGFGKLHSRLTTPRVVLVHCTKRPSLLASVETASKKRASSEVSLESSQPPPKKKKAMIIDHTTTTPTPSTDLSTGISGLTQKQLKKALAQAERMEREKERKEKKQREEEARKAKKMGRVKGGPVNVNEQCGVLIPPNNIPCARSLTCKTHSMGAKRSVPGRSADYDWLLNEWQKKNNPNWGDRKVVTPRVGPGIEPGVSKKKKKEAAAGAQNSSGDTAIASSSGSRAGPKDKEKDVTKTGTKSHSSHNKAAGGGHGGTGGGGGAHGSSRKKDGHHRGEGGRSAGDKLSAASEAKLLGEVDEDFYFTPLPAKPKPANEAEELITEQESGSQSDLEIELILQGIVASHPGQPLATAGMGSAWVTPRWAKFGKLGIKEGFRDAFRG